MPVDALEVPRKGVRETTILTVLFAVAYFCSAIAFVLQSLRSLLLAIVAKIMGNVSILYMTLSMMGC